MTTATMTLTEFLLARIAEDEAAAGNWLRFEVRDGIPGNYAIKERVLAECEAKRRIVGIHDRRGDQCGGHPGPYMPHGDYGSGLCERADEDSTELRALAAIYADHADYRPEWRP